MAKTSRIDPAMFSLRTATPSDYDAVMDINENVYQGYDYLAQLYHAFLRDSDIRMYVGIYNDKMIMFMAIWMQDDGKDVLSFARRVRSEYQGRGVMTRAVELMHVELRSILQHAYCVVYTAYFNSKVHTPDGLLKDRAKVQRTWNAIPYVFSGDHLGSLTMNCNDNVRRFDSDTTLSLLQDDNTQRLLKRGGEYMSCFSWWHVIKISHKTVSSITTLFSEEELTVQFSLNNGQVTAISFCSEITNKDQSMTCNIFFYGSDSTENSDCWISHVRSYLNVLRKTQSNVREYRLMIHLPIDLCVDKVEEHIMPILGERYSEAEYDDNIRAVLVRENSVPTDVNT